MTSLIAQIGRIAPPPGTVPVTNDPTKFVADLIRDGIEILLIVAFILAFVWTIFAGFSFIFSGDDPKAVSSAWSRIYWGLLGLVIVVGSFAIIKLVEDVFGIKIISEGIRLPTR